METGIKSLNVIGGFKYGFIFLVTLTSNFLKQLTQYNPCFELFLTWGHKIDFYRFRTYFVLSSKWTLEYKICTEDNLKVCMNYKSLWSKVGYFAL